MDSASAQHDLCNTCQAGKLRDLIRYIITVQTKYIPMLARMVVMS